MKNRIKIALITALFAFSACNYLDVVPDNVATIDYAFRNRASAIKFLYTCYSYMPHEGNIDWNESTTGGDEVWMHAYVTWSTMQLGRGLQNANNPLCNYWRGENGSNKPLWQAIRDCNIFLENIDGVVDVPAYEKTRWKAEVKFLKAYFHFYLFRMYGPIPIVDVNLSVDAGVDDVKVYRQPVDDVVKYIVDLMEEAAADAVSTVLPSGQMEITTRISVVFLLE